jgi:2-phospho-L-lactate guanylyltransferase
MSGVPDPARESATDAALDRVADAFSRISAVIPVRDLETAKSRLGEALDPEERQALVLRLLDRVIRAALDARSITSVLVVSPDRELLARSAAAGADVLRQRDPGLNQGLVEARAWVRAGGASGMLVLPADLPSVTPGLIDEITERGRDEALRQPGGVRVVVVVPDRHGDGTNALLLVPPDVGSFEFGPGSRQRHGEAARRMGAAVVEISGPLSLDVDLPDDLLVAETEGVMGVEA